MTGVQREWIAHNNFVMIHFDLVDALDGSWEAAALVHWIAFKGRDRGYVATMEQLQDELRLSEWKMKRAVKEAREAGFIESERENSHESTLRWRVVYEDEYLRLGTEETSSPGREETSGVGGRKPPALFSKKNEEVEKGGASRATPAPSSFPLTEQMWAWWRAQDCSAVSPTSETAKFLDYHRAKGSTFKDWTAAWRTWMRRAADGPPGRPARVSADPEIPRWMR